MANIVRAFGFAWFRREDYNRCLKIFIDSKVLPSQFDKWLKLANRALDDCKRQGNIAEKVYIDPDTFPAWCASRGLDVDAKARMAYASEVVAQKYRNQS
ncbi:MAG: hypothetical protein KZQ94_10300 [Candidatus Thiodiazotropha sp. (ex Troendleina suluensis)]|nr:hypothetical protein [Candidatus Thiodiazotropha sp. (ex Troendleina suluensis)]